MKTVLILGGTQFIGRNLVEKLEMLAGYDITLFNRQKTHPDLFPDIAKIKGDRETNDIEKLAGQDWDYVIDLSGYYPGSLNDLLDKLKGKIGLYIFISTISVYPINEDSLKTVIDERLETLSCDSSQEADKTMATYGQRKAECERVLLRNEWLDKIILRPSIVYGKYDPFDRLYYWLYRTKNKLPVILPDEGKDKVTLTFVDDLVNIMIRSMEVVKHSTIYNATTHQPLTMKEMIGSMASDARIINISKAELADKGIRAGIDLPLWFNASLMISNERLKKDLNIDFLPFRESVAETVGYYEKLGWPLPKAGLDIEKEKEIINELQARS